MHYLNISKPRGKPYQTISPTSDYIVYEFRQRQQESLAQTMSTVFVVSQKDDRILMKENLNIEKVIWLSNHIVRFKIIPEVIKAKGEMIAIDFNVRTGAKTNMKQLIMIK